MSTATKTCLTCQHRLGAFDYGRCVRTGKYITMELEFGGRCRAIVDGAPVMKLWEPRRTIVWHIVSLFTRGTA